MMLLLSTLTASVVLVHCICVLNGMGRRTSTSVRLVYVFLAVAVAWEALEPFYGAEVSPADVTLMSAIATYLLLNRRRRPPFDAHRPC